MHKVPLPSCLPCSSSPLVFSPPVSGRRMGPASFLPPCPPSATLAAACSLLTPAAAAADAASAEINPPRVCPEQPGLLEPGLGWLTLPDRRESQPSAFPALPHSHQPKEGDGRLGLGAKELRCLMMRFRLLGLSPTGACIYVCAWKSRLGAICESVFQCAQVRLHVCVCTNTESHCVFV